MFSPCIAPVADSARALFSAPLRRSFASTSVGTSAAECALLCAVAPAGLALRRALAVLGAPRSGAVAAFLDFATLVAPTLGVRSLDSTRKPRPSHALMSNNSRLPLGDAAPGSLAAPHRAAAARRRRRIAARGVFAQARGCSAASGRCVGRVGRGGRVSRMLDADDLRCHPRRGLPRLPAPPGQNRGQRHGLHGPRPGLLRLRARRVPPHCVLFSVGF